MRHTITFETHDKTIPEDFIKGCIQNYAGSLEIKSFSYETGRMKSALVDKPVLVKNWWSQRPRAMGKIELSATALGPYVGKRVHVYIVPQSVVSLMRKWQREAYQLGKQAIQNPNLKSMTSHELVALRQKYLDGATACKIEVNTRYGERVTNEEF